MKRILAPAARRSHARAIGYAILAVIGLLAAARAAADYPGVIVRVEEDWEYRVATGGSDGVLPEVTCAMSPLGGHDGDYMTFELNHQSQPGYESGGLHLNLWHGEALQGSVHAQPDAVQGQTGEVVSWTQTMTLQEGLLTYEITNGTSTTWNAFGTGELKASVASSLADLNGYDVNQSVEGLVLATDGVSYLVLKSVRLVTSTGTVLHITVDRDVLAEPEPQPEPPSEPGQ
jgi:hypothetical protein